MLIIKVKDNEPIDRALRRYKRKVRNTKLLREFRKRKHFEKKSVQRRHEVLKAIYKDEKDRAMED
ncbi:30S ribosomal protein S21 [Saprospira sp. CCB-QB6]|uniref:30S ribosomal protein S21 n=1 Tax=Saprospira sp. CCB-QB6 TaxID=3023936 RepID=UPI002348F491|nr:30S ribosomal protein S21 [Saprospira sp. CCB-QB6]WCL81491.1 30S ribosomal protein S21 [Saprospira sp. CCB-QB6]